MEKDFKEYLNTVDVYQKFLSDKNCPKCNKGKLSIISDYQRKSLSVACNNCSMGKWNHINDFTKEYSKYKKMYPIYEMIKNNSENAVKKSLKKALSKIVLNVEDVITKQECDDAVFCNPRNIYSIYNNLSEISGNFYSKRSRPKI